MVTVDIGKIEKAIADSDQSQAQIARSCGISPQHLWLLIHGQRRLTATNFARICHVLNIPMESFLACDTNYTQDVY
jgi:transcriptional regulator with XRE-family HTH domain